MKVIYYSKAFLADCDFPLVKALQQKEIDVYYFIPLTRNFQKSVLFNFRKPMKKEKIFKASEIEEMRIFKDCLDLNKLYFISGYSEHIWWPFSWILWLKAIWIFKKINPDIIHLVYHLSSPFEKLIYKLSFKGKKIVTVHDPFIHPNKPNADIIENDRKQLFTWADKYILLNKIQLKAFSEYYKIPFSQIHVSHLGIYDSITKVIPQSNNIKSPYILFFGLMAYYKGLDILLEAMKEVHSICPELRLVIAGGGNLDFNIDEYKNCNYIEWRHRYIDIEELAGLLKYAEFSVCPYRDATQSGVVQTSLSMECPVIVTQVGALATAIENDITGKIIPPCDVQILSKAIIDWHKNPAVLNDIRYNIKTKWKFSMNWESIAETYIKCYNE